MSDFDQIKVKLKLSIGFPVANREDETYLCEHISEDEWNKLGFFEKDQFVEKQILKEWACEYIEMCSEVMEPTNDQP